MIAQFAFFRYPYANGVLKMKYLSSAMLVVCFVLFVLFTENFMVSINSKIMFWDHMTSVLNREAFITILGWGISLIFIVFIAYTLSVAVILGMSLAKPKMEIEVRLDALASAHLLLIYAILMTCICGVPVFQIITNSYILHGFANYLIWLLAACALGVISNALYSLYAAIKLLLKAFKD